MLLKIINLYLRMILIKFIWIHKKNWYKNALLKTEWKVHIMIFISLWFKLSKDRVEEIRGLKWEQININHLLRELIQGANLMNH
jgi:hypothetical protein